MKKNNSNRLASLIAGLLFYFSASIYIFRNEDWLPGILLGIAGTVFIFQSLLPKQGTPKCDVDSVRRKRARHNPFKIFGVTFGVVLVMFGLGFAVGNIIAHFVK